MSSFNKETIDNLADKLLIGLTDEENEMILNEFDEIDRKIDLINQVDGINDVRPMTNCLDDFEYCLHDDEYEESIEVNDALLNTKYRRDREIEIPKVVG